LADRIGIPDYGRSGALADILASTTTIGLEMDLLDNPEQWRKRAEEARTVADGMRSPETKRIMLGIAASYEVLAKRAEQRRAGYKPLKRPL